MVDTSDNSAPILSKTALIKGISPDSANIIDTFKNYKWFFYRNKNIKCKI